MSRRTSYFWMMFCFSVLANFLDFWTTEYCLGAGVVSNGQLWEKNEISAFLFHLGAGRFAIVFVQIYVLGLTVLSLLFHLYVYPLLHCRRFPAVVMLKFLRLGCILYPYGILSAKIFISLSNYLIGYQVHHPSEFSLLSDVSAFWYEQVVSSGNEIQSYLVIFAAVLGAVSGFFIHSCQQPVDNL